MAKFRAYYVWIEGKPGVARHELAAEIAKYPGFQFGRSCGTLTTALSWLREYVAAGFIVSIYGGKD